MKKLVSFILVCTLCLCGSVSVMATEVEENDALVYSPEFPDAYIVTEEAPANILQTSSTQTVSASVFVEETYAVDQNGNIVILESKLLPEEEVLAIGVDQFEDMGKARNDAILEAKQTRAAVNSKGKLTITFSGNHSVSGNSVTCNLTGNASWSGGNDIFSGSTSPAAGTDFIGVVWSGGFTATSASATPAINLPVTMCASVPNMGRVWEFNEYIGATVYQPRIDVNVTLHKNNMTGGGNTAEVVLQYVHTYADLSWSASIGVSTGGPSVGFSVSPQEQQWGIVCTITNVPY